MDSLIEFNFGCAIIDVLTTLIFLIIFFGLIEHFFAQKKHAFFSKERNEDVAWLFLNELFYPFLMGGISFKLGLFLEGYLKRLGLVWDLSQYAVWIQFLIFIIFIDFVSFIFHYAIHKYKTLWSFHKLHHTSTELTFTSAFRSSWSNNIIQGIFYGVATSFLAINENVRMISAIITTFVCVAQHVSLKLIFPSLIENIIVTPKNHFWHHSKEKHFSFGQNFGLILTIWDHLFRTYYNPPHFNTEIGLSEKFQYTSHFSKLIYPFDLWIKRLFLLIVSVKKSFRKDD
jgi:sterol desaturase/sphingolipid hydroxylase (fatty acid hydroxylase superfamily)